MSQGPPQQKPFFDDARHGLNVLSWLSAVHAVPLEVWWRKPGTIGARHFTPTGGIALVYYPCFLALCPVPPTAAHYQFYFLFGLLSLAGLIAQRAKRQELERQDVYTHSRCKGVSRVGYKLEAFLTFCLGLACLPLSQPLAFYLVAGALALSFNQALIEHRDDALLRDMRDAQWEQDYYSRKMRR